MNNTRALYSLLAAILLAFPTHSAYAEPKKGVVLTELDDRIRVEIDGRLFTEWRHKAWAVPYLYPVIGPYGENVTRHYPMLQTVPGESPDHKHHRSIRFSHRGINGFSFWSPDSDKKNRARITLEKIEKIAGGTDSGEVVLHNAWVGNDKLILSERLVLRFTAERSHGGTLLDYDSTLTAAEDATFVDQKDGGLAVRVAGWMRVEGKDKSPGQGTILNSRGDRNAEAWGKRAEWASYFAPDPQGRIVGISIFDHPSNLRYPTHWHARTYGLIAANRFGTGHFEAKKGAQKGDGEFTLKAGETITLRHRLFIHKGTPEEATVAELYRKYSTDQ